MRTKLWVVATLLVVIAMLAACGAAPEPETVVQTVEVEVEKTVVETVEVEVEVEVEVTAMPAAKPYEG
ncbi:MAG: hypothetical protein PVF77_04960, partial [Anaerolineae bacterium]